MLKRGVYTAEMYAENAAASRLFRRTRFAYTLLRTSSPPSRAEIDRFEYILQHLGLSGGVFRTTMPRRFESLDAFLMPILEAQFPRDTALLAEDWAASACVTSAEWFHLLRYSASARIRNATQGHARHRSTHRPARSLFANLRANATSND